MAATINPPGKGRIIPAPTATAPPAGNVSNATAKAGSSGAPARFCGDPGWDYVNGTDYHHGMACRISCGYRWTANDPGWRAQILPSLA